MKRYLTGVMCSTLLIFAAALERVEVLAGCPSQASRIGNY